MSFNPLDTIKEIIEAIEAKQTSLNSLIFSKLEELTDIVAEASSPIERESSENLRDGFVARHSSDLENIPPSVYAYEWVAALTAAVMRFTEEAMEYDLDFSVHINRLQLGANILREALEKAFPHDQEIRINQDLIEMKTVELQRYLKQESLHYSELHLQEKLADQCNQCMKELVKNYPDLLHVIKMAEQGKAVSAVYQTPVSQYRTLIHINMTLSNQALSLNERFRHIHDVLTEASHTGPSKDTLWKEIIRKLKETLARLTSLFNRKPVSSVVYHEPPPLEPKSLRQLTRKRSDSSLSDEITAAIHSENRWRKESFSAHEANHPKTEPQTVAH